MSSLTLSKLFLLITILAFLFGPHIVLSLLGSKGFANSGEYGSTWYIRVASILKLNLRILSKRITSLRLNWSVRKIIPPLNFDPANIIQIAKAIKSK
jgi:hypothetical protein